MTEPVWPLSVSGSGPLCQEWSLSVRGSSGLMASRSQTLMTPPRLDEASRRPSGLKATLVTPLVWPVRVRRSCPVATSQTVTVPSGCLWRAGAPSGLKATAVAPLVAAEDRGSSSPVVASQTRTMRPSVAEANHLPSGLYATLRIRPVAFEGAEADLLTGRHVPDPHVAVGVTAARDQAAAIGAEGHAA